MDLYKIFKRNENGKPETLYVRGTASFVVSAYDATERRSVSIAHARRLSLRSMGERKSP